MKRFYILISVSFFIVAVNKICLSEDIKGNISNTTQIVIEHDTAVNEENMTQAEWEKRERDLADKALFENKCGKCHSIERPLSYKKTLKDWNMTVERMQKKDLSWILPAEAITIADYLFKINGIKEKEEGIKPDTNFQLKKIK